MGGFDSGGLAALFAVAAVAGCFDSIAGGGGLLTIPALLLVGLDPVSAIATNKLQGAAATLSATAAFARQRLIDWRSAAPVAITAGLGSVVGAFCVSLVSRPVLEGLVPALLMAVAVYFAVGRRMREEDAHARVSPLVFVGGVAPAIGFYDGMFGPGGGSFYMLGFVGLLGYGVLRATAHTKLANAASGLGSLGVYTATAAVVWPVGLVMALGAVLGAQVGSHLAIRLGARLIRPLLVVVCSGLTIRLLLEPSNPLHKAGVSAICTVTDAC
jgi:uncharacterized protein